MKRSCEDVDSALSTGPWKKIMSQKHNSEYWYNELTKQSVWEDPTTNDLSTSRNVKSKIIETLSPTWKKSYSERYQRDYWFDEVSGQKSWEDPNKSLASNQSEENVDVIIEQAIYTQKKDIVAALARERKAVAVDAPTCPREIETANLALVMHRLRTESPIVDKSQVKDGYSVVFKLSDDDTAIITRAVQEDQILKTRLKAQKGAEVIDLPSFWDVWKSDAEFRNIIINSKDPNEAKWSCQRTHNYKLATTFMPAYAKAIYEHFKAETVLDPCAGWGDRLCGAASSSLVKKYVCFDPNTTLRPGYADLMKLYGHDCTEVGPKGLKFSNGFECRTQPFEVGALELESNSFDLVFTSPPFFDYEMYNPDNPNYVDWIEQFYVPLFVQAARCVKPGCYVGIHIGDTSAGNIELFLKTRVKEICPLKLKTKVGLHGMMSGKTRTVWMYQKTVA